MYLLNYFFKHYYVLSFCIIKRFLAHFYTFHTLFLHFICYIQITFAFVKFVIYFLKREFTGQYCTGNYAYQKLIYLFSIVAMISYYFFKFPFMLKRKKYPHLLRKFYNYYFYCYLKTIYTFSNGAIFSHNVMHLF